jgi:hypothetical protein
METLLQDATKFCRLISKWMRWLSVPLSVKGEANTVGDYDANSPIIAQLTVWQISCFQWLIHSSS